MGVIVVEELIVIIGIGQFKWHSLEEHVNLINRQNTVVQFHVGITRYRTSDFSYFFYPLWIVRINFGNSCSDWVVTIQVFRFNWFWFFQFRNHSYILDEII